MLFTNTSHTLYRLQKTIPLAKNIVTIEMPMILNFTNSTFVYQHQNYECTHYLLEKGKPLMTTLHYSIAIKSIQQCYQNSTKLQTVTLICSEKMFGSD